MNAARDDGRPSTEELLEAFGRLERAGWEKRLIASQLDDGGERLPIYAYESGRPAERVVIGGIHGREPAGANAIARFVDRLVELGRKRPILLLPLLNPWGYRHDSRYGPTGASVSDSDYWLGRSDRPACAEAEAIVTWLLERASVAPGAAVLDLHEDPVFEEPGYRLDGRGSYLYLTGTGAADTAAARRVTGYLRACRLPLILAGTTRFGETLHDGVIVDTEDGSIDELLAKELGCSPVITTELILRSRTDPPLDERVGVYLGALEAFFGD